MTTKHLIEDIGEAVDVVGVVLMVAGAAFVLGREAVRALRGAPAEEAYRRVRHGVGRSILLGLELLIVGDIIRTVAVTPTFRSVGVLAVIVVIRTFLSVTLELEITGRWPWQKAPTSAT
ncbi:DUF1622 domain-containing protein [Aquihabitans sp. G128]|uniref:DUF1622 domain-containing protein n=1 Tax=Aquihabitans sp. G128 TaxID=2849779 RepID=UPI00352E6D78